MTDQSDDHGRRTFIKLGLAVIPAGLAAGSPRHAEAQGTSAKHAYRPKFFTDAEWNFVSAICDRIIPADENGPGALDAGVPEFIDRQLETPWGHGDLWYRQAPFLDAPPELGVQLNLIPRQVYRLGIVAMDEAVRGLFHKPFTACDTQQRDVAIATLEQGKLDFGELPSGYFFALLLQNTREGFFSDPVHGGNRGMIGWKLVGFPGARADFWDWVDRYDGKPYPLPPVSIDSQRS